MVAPPESPLPGLRTEIGFLAAVSSEVRDAFLKIKDTIPIVKTYKPSPIVIIPEPITKEPPKNDFDVKVPFAKVRQKNSYELITRHLLQALQNEAKVVQQQSSRTALMVQKQKQSPLSSVKSGQMLTPSIRPISPIKKSRRGTERRQTIHGRSIKDRHYFYKKHHLPTPPFVRRLAAKFRMDTDFDEHISQSPEPTRGLSIVSTPPNQVRGFSKNTSHCTNPYMTPESRSLAETGRFGKVSRQLFRVTLPVLGPNRVQTETVHLRDKSFRVPVLNFDQRAMTQRFKAARNNPEYLAGIKVECGQEWRLSDKSHVVSEPMPFPRSQLLATARRDRKMQVNKRFSIVQRTRDLNRKENYLALRKRKVEQMQERLQSLDDRLLSVAEQNQQNAIEHEAELRRSDQGTILAIHIANETKAEREQAESLLSIVEGHNNLLYCHNVRREEKIKLIDRFINVIYAAIPENLRKALLDRRKKERQQRRLKGANQPVLAKAVEIRQMSNILACYKSLSEESKFDFPSDEEDIEGNEDKVLPLLLDNPADVFQHLDELHRQSTETCHIMGQLRFESRGIRTKVGIEGEYATQKNKKIQLDCERVEEEIQVLIDDVEIIKADNARYETKEFRRDHMRRPINTLRNFIFRYYRRNFEAPEESIKKMMDYMHDHVAEIMEKFQNIPLSYVRECYRAAEADPTIKDYVTEGILRRDEHDRKMQKYYYKSIDPPEIIWGRPNTPHREVAEYVAANHIHDYEAQPEVIVAEVDFDDIAAHDEETWLASRIRQMTELEFEGIPSPVQTLEEEDDEEKFERLHPDELAQPHELPGSHAQYGSSRVPTFYLTAPQAHRVENILKDLELDMEGAQMEVLPLPAVISYTQTPQVSNPTEEVKKEAAPPKQKSYPDLTAQDVEKDQKTKNFFDNYETMMMKDEPAPSATAEPTAELPASVVSDELPASVASDELLASVVSDELPASVVSDELPASVTPDELPASVASDELPGSVVSDSDTSENASQEGSAPQEDNESTTSRDSSTEQQEKGRRSSRKKTRTKVS